MPVDNKWSMDSMGNNEIAWPLLLFTENGNFISEIYPFSIMVFIPNFTANHAIY